MKPAMVGTLVLAALAAGCSSGPTNPNLLAPKVVLHPWEDGNVTVYVHSAFGERGYDRLAVLVDNATLAERADAFSLEARVASEGFFLTVRADADGETFETRLRVDVDRAEGRVRYAILDAEGRWDGPRDDTPPFELILERVPPEGSP